MTPSPVIAVYGLGIIGSRVLARLRHCGFQACGWNRSPRPGLEDVSPSVAAAAAGADVHQLFVRDGGAVLEVLHALAPRLGRGKTVLVHATLSPGEMRAAAEGVAATGADFLEAPFTGSREAAAAGRLVYYVGGDPAVLGLVRPVLEASSRAIEWVGGVGDATVLKIATNLVTASIVQALAEALAVTRAGGVAPELLRVAVEHNACRSGTSDLKLPTMLAGDFSPHFSLRNMLKDAHHALALARDAGLTLPSLAQTTAVMERLAADPAQAGMDFSLLARQWDPAPSP